VADITALALAAGRGDRAAATAFIRAAQRDVMSYLAPLTAPTGSLNQAARRPPQHRVSRRTKGARPVAAPPKLAG
jgi:hypothetical protein